MRCSFSYLTGRVLLCLPLLLELLAVMPKLRQELWPCSLCSLWNQSFPKASSGHRLLSPCRSITISISLFYLEFTHGNQKVMVGDELLMLVLTRINPAMQQSVVWKQRGPDHNREDPGIPEQHAEHLDRLLKAFCRQRQPATLFGMFVSFLKANEAFDFFFCYSPSCIFFVPLFFDESGGFQLFSLLLLRC